MRTLILLLLTTLGLSGQSPRYEVMQISRKPHPVDPNLGAYIQTNSFVLRAYEIAELVSSANASFQVTTPEGRFNGTPTQNAGHYGPLVLLGPATIAMTSYEGYALFKITPSYYPFEKASLVMPGPGGAEVTMECSTDLVNWVTATNGTYTNMPAAKFFRINLRKIEVDLTPPVKAAP